MSNLILFSGIFLVMALCIAALPTENEIQRQGFYSRINKVGSCKRVSTLSYYE